MFRFLLLTAAGAMLLAAQGPLDGPSLGFIFDARGQALRPIRGIPGASLVGDPLQAASPLRSAALSLKQNIAIVNDGAWKALKLASSADAVALPDGLPSDARVVVSETGTAAAFYDSAAATLSILTGIATPDLALSTIALDWSPGGINALAVSDTGSMLVAMASPDSGEVLLWIGSDGSTRQLATLQAAASIMLTARGATAIVTDRGASRVWKIQDPGGNAAITMLASDADGVSSPAGAALSADGKQLWIANAGAHNLLGINLESRTTVSLDGPPDLTTLLPLADGLAFRLNELGTGPLWLLDAAPGVDPRIVFIPALPSTTPDTQEAAQ